MITISNEAATKESAGAFPAWARSAILRQDAEELIFEVVGRCLFSAFPDRSEDEEFRILLHASTTRNIRGLRALVDAGSALAEIDSDPVDEFARAEARLGIAVSAAQHSYRVSFLTIWQTWTDTLRSEAELLDVPRWSALSALSELTRLVFRYQDRVATRVSEIHLRDIDQLSRSQTYARHRIVRSILIEPRVPLGEIDRLILDYPLDGSHIAIGFPTRSTAQLSEIRVRLDKAAGVRETLSYPLSDTASVIWARRSGAWAKHDVERVTTALRDLGEMVSMSGAKNGPEALAETLQQVRLLERIRSHGGREVQAELLEYDDFSIELLFAENAESAFEFVRQELGPLASNTEEAARLRETLELSMKLNSHVAVAKHLGLHEHTIRNRLAKASEAMERPWAERRAELLVALRLARMLTVNRALQTTGRGLLE